MNKKYDLGYCARCKAKITHNNLGDCIDADEVLVCDICAKEHTHYLIKELETFRNSKEFESVYDLKKKILWTSEQMGHWFDNADKSVQESVSDYDNLNAFELQLFVLDNELTLIENLLQDNDGFPLPRNTNPKLWDLRDKVSEHHSRVISYIDKEEFFKK